MASKTPSRRSIVAALGLVIASVVVDLAYDGIGVLRTRDPAEHDADGEPEPSTDPDAAAAELEPGETLSLPEVDTDGEATVEQALYDRRSRRTFDDTPLNRKALGQLLWAAQGVTDPGGYRAAPSAGALYPLELYVVVGRPGVDGLDRGVYRYDSENHELEFRQSGSFQADLKAAAVDQSAVEEAPIDIVICGVDQRTTERYGQRGKRRYVPMEAGHVGQNLYLQAEALDLSTVAIGAFDDTAIREVIGASEEERPLYVFPIGHPPS